MVAQHQSLITAVVNGKPVGEFATRTGGESSGEVGKYRPSAGAKQRTRKGLTDNADVTITREMETEDYDLVRDLRKVAGRGSIVITDQPLDDDDVAFGRPTIFTGTLMSANGGDVDANSNDARDLELVAVITEVS